ncbi:sigma-54-dependent Fis family transcriptional regulator [bacterium]|nr:sigma-54-dependent Fis family transcriptional regulator [bacterium]
MNKKKYLILIAEDEDIVRETLAEEFGDRGFAVLEASDGLEALKLAREKKPDLLLTDLKMPGLDGMELVEKLAHEVPIILMTAYGTVSNAVLAMEKGAFSFVEKPIDWQRLFALVEKALQHGALKRENRDLKERLERSAFGNIIGESAAMKEVFAKIRQVASSDTTVLVTGESGTGKELVVSAIQSLSPRANAPFIKLNCAAIPENLLESELFGHEKGAFTGAEGQRRGKFEQADGGTLFMDEIAEMKPNLQAKLLRVLQDGEFTRLGGSQTIKADARILCATNADIKERMEKGLFRSDLYYRIGVFSIELPPLRERKGDVILLAEHFLIRSSENMSKKLPGFSKEALSALREYDWPGNVRQLKNAVEYATLLAFPSEEIGLDCLPEEIRAAAGDPSSVRAKTAPEPAPDFEAPLSLKEMEKKAIEAALKRHNGNKAAAAKELGIGLKTIYRKVEEYQIEG